MTWIQTYTGKKFDLLNPSPDDVCIEDIAHSLSMICRFNGHCRDFYSVAEHSCILSEYMSIHLLMSDEIALEGLLHDATEAYVGDMVSPLKNAYCMEEFVLIEHDIRCVIAEKFRLEPRVPDPIYRIDRCLLATEAQQFMGPEVEPWFDEPVEVLPIQIYWHMPELAEVLFLERFHKLTNQAATPASGAVTSTN